MDAPASVSARPFRPEHFRVVHELTRRVRIVAPALRKDPERAYVLEILLRKRPEIRRVRAVPAIGSLVIEFAPASLPKRRLLALLDRLLGGVAARPRGTAGRGEAAGRGGPACEVNLAIEEMTCASCALLIEMVLRRDPRVREATVNFASATAVVRGELSKEEVFDAVERLGYRARPMDTLAQRRLMVERERAHLAAAKRRALWAGGLSLPVMAVGMLMPRSRLLHWFEFLFTTPVVLWAGRPFFATAWRLARQRASNMDTLIAIGTGAAYGSSIVALLRREHHLFFEAAAGIITFVLLGRYLEERAKGRAGEAIRRLIDLQPATATVVRDGSEISIDAEAVVVGDLIVVRPGERIPTDGVVVAGHSAVDESLVTGESIPVTKVAGDTLIGGCVNSGGVLRMRAEAVGRHTVLAGIIRMVDRAQSARLPVQKTADRVAAVFVPAVMAASGLTLAAWLVAGRLGPAIGNAIAVSLIACPCAVGLATPTAVMVATGEAARRGIYIRNGRSLETASRLSVIVFDKTGTITEGNPRVTDLLNRSPLPDAELIALAAAVEADSEHFLGQAIVAHAREAGPQRLAARDFLYRPGLGVQARVGRHTLALGNRAWIRQQGIDPAPLEAWAETLAAQGKTPVLAALDGAAAAVIGVADRPRANARAAIERLRSLGIDAVMVTGDTDATARHVAAEVGIEEVIAQATPARKLETISALRAGGARVGMIGDGVNDAPALAAADVSFAVGTGTDIAIEAADMALVGGDIGKVVEAVELSGRTMRVIKQNLFWALGYNTIAIPVAASGRLSPMIASAAMAMSSVSVVANSLRLQRR